MSAFDVTVGFSTPDPVAVERWRAFVEAETLATVTTIAASWLDMIIDPLFPPDIAILTVGGCSLRALGSQIHTCRLLGVLVILDDPQHLVDAELALHLDVLFIFHEETEAHDTLAAVRAYRNARATGQPIRINTSSR